MAVITMDNPSADAIGEAIGELRQRDTFATTDYGPAPQAYVTIVEGDSRMYPAMLDYYPDENVTDAELISNSFFEEILPTLEYGAEPPQSVVAKAKTLETNLKNDD